MLCPPLRIQPEPNLVLKAACKDVHSVSKVPIVDAEESQWS